MAYAGGVALNAVANRRIICESKFANLYIQPAAGDNGLAVGCAYYGWLRILERERRKHDGTTAFGRAYPNVEITESIDRRVEEIQYANSSDVIQETASLLAQGKTVGWFQGRSEFGPRALGHRSILADPRVPGVRDFINARIKFREDFRPFAPAVLDCESSMYFDCHYASPYMVMVAPARDSHVTEISAVVHLDGSSRLQTVSRENNPRFYSLLECFHEHTGLPVLLNTSLNRKGMPIVETPAEALSFFLECELDVLVLNDFIVKKRLVALQQARNLDSLFETIGRSLASLQPHTFPVRGKCEIRLFGTRTWTIDLSRDDAKVFAGKVTCPDVILEMEEADFWKIAEPPSLEYSPLDGKTLQLQGSVAHAAILLWSLRQVERSTSPP